MAKFAESLEIIFIGKIMFCDNCHHNLKEKNGTPISYTAIINGVKLNLCHACNIDHKYNDK